MTKRKYLVKIKENVYNSAFWIFVEPNNDRAAKEIKRFYPLKDKHMVITDQYDGIAFMDDNDTTVVIWLRSYDLIVLVHELGHAAFRALKYCGIIANEDMCDKNFEEIFNYLQGSYLNQVLKAWKINSII